MLRTFLALACICAAASSAAFAAGYFTPKNSVEELEAFVNSLEVNEYDCSPNADRDWSLGIYDYTNNGSLDIVKGLSLKYYKHVEKCRDKYGIIRKEVNNYENRLKH